MRESRWPRFLRPSRPEIIGPLCSLLTKTDADGKLANFTFFELWAQPGTCPLKYLGIQKGKTQSLEARTDQAFA